MKTMACDRSDATRSIELPEPCCWQLLERSGLTRAWFRRVLDELVASEYGSAPPVEALSGRIASHFLRHRSRCRSVVLSILQLSDPELAQEFYFRIKNGEADFADLSRHSLGAERHTLGRIGPLEVGRLSPVMQDLVDRCIGDQVHPPVETDVGEVVLMRVETLQEAKLDQALRERMARELYDSWCRQVIQQLLDQRGSTVEGIPTVVVNLHSLLEDRGADDDV